VKRLCVFCGSLPRNKSKEHVIPRWLLRLTGDPGRTVNFGVQYLTGEVRRFSFERLTFPACVKCNEKYSELEAEAQRIVTRILEEQSLATTDLFTLMDWLDKVRVGLWLGVLTLNNNAFAIEPKFFISQRLRAHDRLLSLYLDSNQSSGLSLVGPFTTAFSFLPSCFAIRINNLCLFNASCPFMVSKNCGFPFPTTVYGRDTDGKYVMEFHDGFLELGSSFVDLPSPPWKASLSVCQPIFSEALPGNSEGYDQEYIRSNCHEWESGLGALIVEANGILHRLSNEDLNLPFLTDSMHPKLMLIQVLVMQNYLFMIPPNIPMEAEGRELWRSSLELNKSLISRIVKET
jgi:hypothetical protein